MILAVLTAVFLAVHAGAVRRVQTQERVVALTFDACATATNTFSFDRPIFDILVRERIAATVFMAGRWIEAHPGEAREIAAQPALELANHSWDHPPFSRLSRTEIERQLDRTQAVLTGLGRTGTAFRPPFGDWQNNLLPVAAARGLPVVLWDVVSGDAGGHLKPPIIVAEVMRQVQPGSIVIFHINGRGPYTKDALPEIIRRLREGGFRFVTVSELLALKDGRVQAAKPARYVRRAEVAALKKRAQVSP